MAPLLYDHPLSSYSQKVKIALREKGVAFRAELPEGFGTGRRDGAFAEASPRGEVPALVDDGLAPSLAVQDGTADASADVLPPSWPSTRYVGLPPPSSAHGAVSAGMARVSIEQA